MTGPSIPWIAEQAKHLAPRDATDTEISALAWNLTRAFHNWAVDAARPPNDSADSIRELELSSRAVYALEQAGITAISDLCRQTPRDLLRLPNFGRRSFEEVCLVLQHRGLSLS